ncbi:hypothetical protein GCM10022380_20940 [Amycolatopsis tucumanensis]|uniref:Uncharacterized protein n=1 Tax=Amycolatopsis tucumanensis TaxID=401106 RepID=A0ABP7HSF4_9PSEU
MDVRGFFVPRGWGGYPHARPRWTCSKQAVLLDELQLVLMKGQQGYEENDSSDLASGPAVPPPRSLHTAHMHGGGAFPRRSLGIESSFQVPLAAAVRLPVAPRATHMRSGKRKAATRG